jgi:hypothetical protein
LLTKIFGKQGNAKEIKGNESKVETNSTN